MRWGLREGRRIDSELVSFQGTKPRQEGGIGAAKNDAGKQ